MFIEHDINLTFFRQKGFKTTTLEGLNWLKTTDADRLMHGKCTDDPFDIMVGEMRNNHIPDVPFPHLPVLLL